MCLPLPLIWKVTTVYNRQDMDRVQAACWRDLCWVGIKGCNTALTEMHSQEHTEEKWAIISSETPLMCPRWSACKPAFTTEPGEQVLLPTVDNKGGVHMLCAIKGTCWITRKMQVQTNREVVGITGNRSQVGNREGASWDAGGTSWSKSHSGLLRTAGICSTQVLWNCRKLSDLLFCCRSNS